MDLTVEVTFVSESIVGEDDMCQVGEESCGRERVGWSLIEEELHSRYTTDERNTGIKGCGIYCNKETVIGEWIRETGKALEKMVGVLDVGREATDQGLKMGVNQSRDGFSNGFLTCHNGTAWMIRFVDFR